MKLPFTNVKTWLLAATVMSCSPLAHALCYKVTGVGTSNSTIPQTVADMGYSATAWNSSGLISAAAPIPLGTIILGTGSESLAAAGTVLATAELPFVTSALKVSYTANQILFKCAASDAGSLYEMYALNGAGGDYYGGKATTDVEGAYITPALGVAYRMTNTSLGKYYTSYWQQNEITSDKYLTVGSTLYIPASAFSDARFELVKTDDVAGTPARNAFGTQIVIPQGYVLFKGSQINTGIVAGTKGSSSSDPFPGVWSTKGSTLTIIRGNTCILGDFDQVVKLPSISAGDLRSGGSSTSAFNVAISCDAGATSGTTSGTDSSSAPVAMGFLVSQANALSQASTLGLVSSSGVSYLLDDNYGTSGVASGVGIRLYSSAGSALNLLSDKNTTGTGSTAGWYGFADLMSETGATASGGKTYAGTFTASLEQIPGQTATAGSVNAQAQIIVSLQ